MVYSEVYDTLSITDRHLIGIALRHYCDNTVFYRGANDVLGLWDTNPNADPVQRDICIMLVVEHICMCLQDRRAMIGDFWRVVFRALQHAMKQFKLNEHGPLAAYDYYEQARDICDNMRLYMPWLVEEYSHI